MLVIRECYSSTPQSSLPPNPCLSSSFQPPLYEFGNFNITKALRFYTPKEWSYLNGVVDFTIRDVANNYSLDCNWGPARIDLGR